MSGYCGPTSKALHALHDVLLLFPLEVHWMNPLIWGRTYLRLLLQAKLSLSHISSENCALQKIKTY